MTARGREEAPTRFRFTAATVARVACPEGQDVAFAWDAGLPGFGIIARPSGRRSWIAQYRIGRQSKRVALGDLNTVTLAEAREKAREILARAKLGHDPQAEKLRARAALTVLEVIQGGEAARGACDGYLAFAKATMRPGSFENAERHLLKHAKPLHRQAMEQVQRAEIATLVRRVEKQSGPAAANKLRTTLAAIWKWATGSGLIAADANPVLLVPKAAERGPRSRVLTDGELALIWRCTAGGHDYDRIVRLLLLTATRREEAGAMMWPEVEMAGDRLSATWTLPAVRSKNALPHEVALGPLAVAQLPKRREGNPAVLGDTETGFSGWSQSKARLDQRMRKALRADFVKQHGRQPENGEVTLSHWTLHDFRRTFSTWANETGIEPHVVEAVLNHVSGAAKRGVAGVYNRATYRTQKAAALAAWEGHIRSVIGLPPLAANVVPLRKAG
jgi:integrase